MRAFRCRPGRWPRTRTRPRAGTHPGAAGASGRIPETQSRSARTDRARTARPMHHPRIHGTVRPRGRRCRSEPRSRTGASKVRRRSRPRRRRHGSRRRRRCHMGTRGRRWRHRMRMRGRRRMRHRLVNHPGRLFMVYREKLVPTALISTQRHGLEGISMETGSFRGKLT